jgi:S-adenosylmethionine hydrolase
LSASFHGRDLFAPVAAMLARGQRPESIPMDMNPADTSWPDDLAEIIYIDRFGNALTGLRAGMLAPGARIQVGEQIVTQAMTFQQVPRGQSFWYENSNGLVELAMNQGRAAEWLQVTVGARVTVLE